MLNFLSQMCVIYCVCVYLYGTRRLKHALSIDSQDINTTKNLKEQKSIKRSKKLYSSRKKKKERERKRKRKTEKNGSIIFCI